MKVCTKKAKKDLNDHMKIAKTLDQFILYLESKNIILAPFCVETLCEDKIKADSARDDAEAQPKSLCVPFEQPAPLGKKDKCIYPTCDRVASFYKLFGRSH